MSDFTYERKILGLFRVERTVPKPRLRFTTKGVRPVWTCSNGTGYPGFGTTPKQAWNDWANWSLV